MPNSKLFYSGRIENEFHGQKANYRVGFKYNVIEIMVTQESLI